MKTQTMTIHELPEEIRPRERLLMNGPKSLATYELLAILLRTGTQKLNALQLGMKVLHHFDSLYELKTASHTDFLQIEGIGPAKAVEIQAAIEFGNRLNSTFIAKKGLITSSEDAGQFFTEALQDFQQEHVLVYFLNTKNEIIKQETVFIGSINTSVAHPREIFKAAVRCSAVSLIIGHNHPSGNPQPSQADIDFTKRLIACGELIGIDVLDHIIVGQERFLSLREYGAFLS
ncbi:RadC family protein [Aerococcus kribbianus]|uniref:DNA repair protein RadC n=1 Tax=Aerococcus kribbianus TaxID=2999064 RepID=A0A9X3JGC6_9LACT|nr:MULTISPECIES: DNA repair protein RadC [unclassified Aerococcus]MCZ0717096.1 DNA repair protein RadC [Aerococcus sp. YH-aer221]MCZ0725384.1 DNA repair protein RadC [Aerococcus sp. YH-aer222]